MDKDYPVHDLTPDLANVEVASRRRAPKASFRRFEAWIIAAVALGWVGFVVWSWL